MARSTPETRLGYQLLYQRVAIRLGSSAVASRPTDERLAAVRGGTSDPQLSALFVQYSRYLLIAGSREDSPLPLNLEGIWNDNLACNMGWTCDFHLDINTQQNYWHAESANLSECHQPLFKLIESIRAAGRKTATQMYGAPGWVCHVFTNAWGYTAPGWGLGWGLHPTGGIWLASHMWEHYLYTGDRDFLAHRAYPVLKEAAEFFLNYMVEHPKYGCLVAASGLRFLRRMPSGLQRAKRAANRWVPRATAYWCMICSRPAWKRVVSWASMRISARNPVGPHEDFASQSRPARAVAGVAGRFRRRNPESPPHHAPGCPEPSKKAYRIARSNGGAAGVDGRKIL